jgi:hypothetical protein
VPRPSNQSTLREYARLGAERRLQELRTELASIKNVFPELFRPGRRAGSQSSVGVSAASAATASDEGTGGAPRRRRRRRGGMSDAQRRAVSERMKRYWAARRKAKG